MRLVLKLLLAIVIVLLVIWVCDYLLPHGISLLLGVIAGLLFFLSDRDIY